MSQLRAQLQKTPVQHLEIAQPVQVQSHHHAHIQTEYAEYTAALAIQSDGLRPNQLTREYNQYALLATVQSSQSKTAWAYERFTEFGPLALLPHLCLSVV